MTEPIVNGRDIDALCSRDAVFARIREQYGPPPGWARDPGFRSLCLIILEQQVSLESARAHFRRLEEFVPALVPAELLKLTDGQMRSCYVSRQKAVYLRELSAAVETGRLDLSALDALSEPEVRTRLNAVKGIGTWTADIYLMFCLQRKDIFPIGDVAVRTAVKTFYPVEEKEQMLTLSEGWKPLRSLASYFFWHAYLVQRGRS